MKPTPVLLLQTSTEVAHAVTTTTEAAAMTAAEAAAKAVAVAILAITEAIRSSRSGALVNYSFTALGEDCRVSRDCKHRWDISREASRQDLQSVQSSRNVETHPPP